MHSGFKFVLALISILTLAACNRLTSDSPTSQAPPEPIVSSKPLFKTKEPQRYRAIRVTTTQESATASSPASSQTTVVHLFRSGVFRREEFEFASQVKLIYLENASGRFILAPDLKSYADLSGTPSLDGLRTTDETATANVSNGLLTTTAVASSYQALGPEQINGRRALKFLVRQNPHESETPARDTFVWIDDELGMPIRSESSYTDAGKTFRFETELREISTELDDNVFELPKGFQKVQHSLLLQRITQLAH